MTVCRNPRPNLSAATLRRRAARTTFFLTLYAGAQLALIAEIFRVIASY